ncbi:predicted protein [Naegleria gruberi]|uniref:Predicted protein n=1 Tax=Naegleria gruberi TaxID=5762 RepID=D2VXH4_NAEGR|nr:uncharacterized protein NAEGRDRAFT_73748 [Naegleria gruberi]EFC38508.1 predicted protein [Naegleria gruberi]|eukprot:XP_002671252.1 predicted protein [Naegleria gruberi strain NEG-M]
MFGGERYIYFVDQNNDIVYFGHGEGDCCKLELSRLTGNNQLIAEKTVSLKLLKINFKKHHPDFIPNEYYRNVDSIYIVDVNGTRVLRIDSAENPEGHMYQLNIRIKEVMSGPLANQFLIINDRNELWELSKKETPVKIEIPNDTVIRCGGCWNGGFLIVDRENKIYAQDLGNHIRSGLGYSDYDSNLNHLSTFLEKKHTIDKVKGGYYHVILRTKENKIFCCGYDNMHQATFGLKEDSSDHNNLTECPLDLGEVIEIGGFSRGEYFLNSKNDVFCIGEMFADFPEKPFPKFPFVQKFNLDELSSLAGVGPLKFNDVLNSGWQCCFFHNSHKTMTKHSRTKEKLIESARNSKLVDVSIVFDD